MPDERPAAWVFEVDPHDIDLPAAFADDEAVIQFEFAPERSDLVHPGQAVHLWVQDRAGAAVAPGIYATGTVVGPVTTVDEDGEDVALVAVGLDGLRHPIDGDALLADPAFAGSPLGAGGASPVALDAAQAEVVQRFDLRPGPLDAGLARLAEAGDDDPEAIVLPALEVRLPDDTFLVVEGIGHDGWTVVRGDPDMQQVVELPDQHRTFIDAVEYVATAVRKAGPSIPVVDVDERLEAVAVFDADGGVYAVLKEAEDGYTFAWVDDDGTLERLDRYATLKEAILLPVLDEELFGGM
jgi:hypothetical protein